MFGRHSNLESSVLRQRLNENYSCQCSLEVDLNSGFHTPHCSRGAAGWKIMGKGAEPTAATGAVIPS